MKNGKFSAIIVASGISERYGKNNKLTEEFFCKSVLQHSIDAFYGLVDEIILVGDYEIEGVKCVKGGSTRYQSVRNGLAAVSVDTDVVGVHDGARPFVSRTLVNSLFQHAALTRHSAVPCVVPTDAMWSTAGACRPLRKEDVVCVQTPQCYNYKMLTEAFSSAKLDNYPDESSLFYERFGEVKFQQGEVSNKKITYNGDSPEYKVGIGFDVHAFTEGNGVILGGVTIPCDRKLLGHSDADALCHAISDAVLSASNNKDIGRQFPDTDPQYKGANSIELLRSCVELAKRNNYEVFNVSAVVICQAPKIAPYIDLMSVNLSDALKIPQSCVNISATTTEHLGALGNGDGIAVQAQALLKRIN